MKDIQILHVIDIQTKQPTLNKSSTHYNASRHVSVVNNSVFNLARRLFRDLYLCKKSSTST